MKRFLTALLVGSLTSVLCAGCGSKQESGDSEPNLGAFRTKAENGVIDLHQAGVKFKVPDELLDKQDKIAGNAYVSKAFISVNIYMDDENNSDNINDCIIQVVGYREDQSIDELLGEDSEVSADAVKVMGTNKSFYYWGVAMDKVNEENPAALENLVSPMDEDRKAEYMDIIQYASKMLDSAELVETNIPAPPKVSDIDTSKLMETTFEDIDGNQVKVGDIVAANKVTMLNYWGVGCGPCVGEMPGLESLYQEYKDQGFAIVGLTTDIVSSDGSFDEGAIEEAKEIREDTGVTYPLLILDLDSKKEANIEATPTTYFVGPDGKVMESVLGAQSEGAWREMINKYLQ